MPSNFRRFVNLNSVRTLYKNPAATLRLQGEALDDRHFAMTLFAALALHAMAIFLWHLMPKTEVIDIPVRALNIKLGEADNFTQEELNTIQPNTANSNTVESTISRLVRDPVAEKQRNDIVAKSMDKAMDALDKSASMKSISPKAVGKERKFDVRSEGTKEAAPVMPVTARQFVRDLAPPPAAPAPVPSTMGNLAAQVTPKPVAGNSNAKDAEMISRYEQMISLWIQKFKQYPNEARAQSMQGETVVRIRMDRRGNIRYYALENSTGYQVLDRAAIDMVRRANPVPAVPNDYPPGDLLEFLIPVNFQMQ